MQKNSTFGHAGGAARVLQHGDIVWLELRPGQLGLASQSHRIVKADSGRQCEGGHHFLDISHHEVDQGALEPSQLIAHGAQHHVPHGRAADASLQRGRKILDDDDGFGARVFELVFQLARRVQRVDIDHHKAGTQDGGHGHRVLRAVGHHDGDAVALGQAQAL